MLSRWMGMLFRYITRIITNADTMRESSVAVPAPATPMPQGWIIMALPTILMIFIRILVFMEVFESPMARNSPTPPL